MIDSRAKPIIDMLVSDGYISDIKNVEYARVDANRLFNDRYKQIWIDRGYKPGNIGCIFIKYYSRNPNIELEYPLILRKNSLQQIGVDEMFEKHEKSTVKGLAITGSADAIFLCNKYQGILDTAYIDLINTVAFLESENTKLGDNFAKTKAEKRDIDSHRKERITLYEQLNSLLQKETDFEKGMWDKTADKFSTKDISIQQKNVGSYIDENQINAMQSFIETYPAYQSKSTFADLLAKISNKENQIREKSTGFHSLVAECQSQQSTLSVSMQKANDKLSNFLDMEKLSDSETIKCKYFSSIFYQILPEEIKDSMKIDKTQYRIIQIKNTLDNLKNEFSKYKITDNDIVNMSDLDKIED